jgi:hypothetical protein
MADDLQKQLREYLPDQMPFCSGFPEKLSCNRGHPYSFVPQGASCESRHPHPSQWHQSDMVFFSASESVLFMPQERQSVSMPPAARVFSGLPQWLSKL